MMLIEEINKAVDNAINEGNTETFVKIDSSCDQKISEVLRSLVDQGYTVRSSSEKDMYKISWVLC